MIEWPRNYLLPDPGSELPIKFCGQYRTHWTSLFDILTKSTSEDPFEEYDPRSVDTVLYLNHVVIMTKRCKGTWEILLFVSCLTTF